MDLINFISRFWTKQKILCYLIQFVPIILVRFGENTQYKSQDWQVSYLQIYENSWLGRNRWFVAAIFQYWFAVGHIHLQQILTPNMVLLYDHLEIIFAAKEYHPYLRIINCWRIDFFYAKYISSNLLKWSNSYSDIYLHSW